MRPFFCKIGLQKLPRVSFICAWAQVEEKQVPVSSGTFGSGGGHTHFQIYKITRTIFPEGNKFWCRWQVSSSRQPGQQYALFPFVWARGSFLPPLLIRTPPGVCGGWGWGGGVLVCVSNRNGKTPYQYILMTGEKWDSSSLGLFAVHKSRRSADRGACEQIGLLTAPEQT